MSRDDGTDDTEQLVRELTEELRTLQEELEPGGGLGLPTQRELTLFTSDVAIPALVLLLRTNIRALELLQRTLRMASGQYEPSGSGARARDRAEQLGRRTLGGLDELLADLQSALEEGDDTRELVDRIQTLQTELDETLTGRGGNTNAADRDENAADTDTANDGADHSTDPVEIDIDAELDALKDDRDEDDEDDED
jgi:hypothetical protein